MTLRTIIRPPSAFKRTCSGFVFSGNSSRQRMHRRWAALHKLSPALGGKSIISGFSCKRRHVVGEAADEAPERACVAEMTKPAIRLAAGEDGRSHQASESDPDHHEPCFRHRLPDRRKA